MPRMTKRYSLTVFGCQMNEKDAETLRGFLDELGYIETDRVQEADLNTSPAYRW